MFGFIIIAVLVAIAAFAAYKSKTPDGWDWKRGVTALAAAGGAAWAWVSGLTDKF